MATINLSALWRWFKNELLKDDDKTTGSSGSSSSGGVFVPTDTPNIDEVEISKPSDKVEPEYDDEGYNAQGYDRQG